MDGIELVVRLLGVDFPYLVLIARILPKYVFTGRNSSFPHSASKTLSLSSEISPQNSSTFSLLFQPAHRPAPTGVIDYRIYIAVECNAFRHLSLSLSLPSSSKATKVIFRFFSPFLCIHLWLKLEK